MFSGEWKPLIAAVPEAGHKKGKQMVSVFLHVGPPGDLQLRPLGDREVVVGY